MKSRSDDVQHTSLSVSLARENSQQAYLPGMCRTVLVDDLVHIFTNDIMALPIHPSVKLLCSSVHQIHTDNSSQAQEATHRP